MKKNVVVVVLAIIMAVSLFGCGKGDKLKGTKWTMTSEESNGKKLSAEELKGTLGEISCEFKKDHEVILTAKENSTTGKYTLDGNKVTLSDDGKETIEGTLDGDKLTFDYNGVKMEMEKSK